MRVCTVSALVLFTVSLAKCQVSMSGSDWDSLFGSAKENAPHKSSSSRNRNRYQHGSKSESPWAQIDPITREPLLQPRIDVQSVLAEGIGWKASMGHETAHHVVITITGVDPDTKSQIAFKNAPIAVKVDWSAAEKRASKPLKCVIETGDGSGKFSRCDLSARPRTLYTNDLGRVSFSLPIPGAFPLKESSHTIGIPALLIQTSFMEDGSWIAAHIDEDSRHKLSNITPEQLKPASPEDTSSESLYAVSKAVSILMESAAVSTPMTHSFDDDEDEPLHIVKRDHVYQAAKKDTAQEHLSYDPVRNRLPTYLIAPSSDSSRDFLSVAKDEDEQEDQPRLLRRDFGPSVLTHQLKKRTGSLDHTTSPFYSECHSLIKRSVETNNTDASHTILVGDEVLKWSLWVQDSGKQLVAIFRNGARKLHHKVIKAVADAWDFVHVILLRIGIRLEFILDSMKDFFEFTDILNSQMYLSTYYRLLAPLGFRGIDIAQRRYRGILSNLTLDTHRLFDDVVHKHYGHDITLDSLKELAAQPYVNNTLTGVVFPPFMHRNHSATVGIDEGTSVYSSDARSHMIIDRIVNNIRHIHITDPATNNKNNSVVMRFAFINQQMASALSEALNDDLLKNAAPHLFSFTKDAKVLDRGIVGIVNLIRTFMTLSEQVLGHVLESIIHLLPHYWNLATGLTFLPLKIPFVYEWYTEKFTRGQSDLTLTDLLTLLGGTVATWTYKLYNDNLPPYTSIDVDVLRTNTEPELILYTWGHDRRTSDTNDNVTHTHRLGMHDWIPRTHWAAVTSLTTTLYDVSMAAYESDVRNPGPYTHLPQMFGTLAGVMGRVGYYPFTQLNSSDPEKVKNSKRNPDGRFHGWWICQIIEDVISLSRPILSSKLLLGPGINRFPRFHLVNLIVTTIPNLAFGLKVQIDTFRSVMKTDDVPRQVAADLGWIQQIIGYINVVLPFIRPFEVGPLKSAYDPGRAKLFMFRIFRDLTNSGINLLRCHMMMGFHVVGMLSSSWQGGNIMGGQRREVIERLERERQRQSADAEKAKKDDPTRN